MEDLAKGSTYTQVPWQTHCPNAMLQELYWENCRLNKDSRYLKSYNVGDRKAKGVSCFVLLEVLHNVPNERLNKREISCYFLPEGTCLSEGLALIYTYKMKLRFPSGEQTGFHFVIAPTIRMTKENCEQLIRGLNWQICTIKASAEMIELVSRDDDLDGIEDFRMNEVYWLMEIWHEQTTCTMDQLHANDIHTWIVLDKPSFQDLIMHEPRAYIVFSALAYLNARTPTSHVTELTYLGNILGELEDNFGWKSSDMYVISTK
ncbi:hypothetical protein C1645_835308 [Glomus cerebriforme]|uniref:Uncharacterized protein n=1 Tax=Glomus cerebriforme TaxID=658196 RepID=A0A397SAJ2_9GLOM|nr:hypothetical protein C1645_835308 [Glomus cerebriforme]